MNRRVLRTMIVLIWVFLIGFAAVKVFFGDQFLAAISNEKISYIGSVIDKSVLLTVVADALLGALAIHFYLCACGSVWTLRRPVYALILVYSLVIANFYRAFPGITSAVDAGFFILIPILCGVRIKRVAVIFTAHTLGQSLLLFIRSQTLYLEGADYVTSFILMFDVYIWLLLYYLYANLYKEEKHYGNSRSMAVRRQDDRRAGKGTCEDRKEDGKAGRDQSCNQG